LRVVILATLRVGRTDVHAVAVTLLPGCFISIPVTVPIITTVTIVTAVVPIIYAVSIPIPVAVPPLSLSA
jgi:hypothetical protein